MKTILWEKMLALPARLRALLGVAVVATIAVATIWNDADQHALQSELERTLASLSSVEKARVHLVLPERGSNDGAHASIVLKVRAGRVISEPQVAGIVQLAASSVPGLAPDRVTLLDDTGRLLSLPANGQGLSSEDLDYKRRFEQSLEAKARSILDSAFGARQSSVQVSAELDFTKVERVEESYDPDKRVIRSEQSSGDNSETRNYEVTKVISKTTLGPARLQRLTAAVLVDGKLPQAELDALASIVTQALGMDDKRGDELAIRSVAFHSSADEKPQEGANAFTFMRDNAKQVALLMVGLAGALALLVVAFSGRKARHHVAPETTLGDQRTLKSAVLNDNQKAVGVLRAWLNEAK